MAATEGPIPTPEEKNRIMMAKKELIQALMRRRALDKQLAQLEVQIHALEGQYLVETSAHSGGNIIHGFEGYLKNQVTKKRYELNDTDRLFSMSSWTYQRSLDLSGEGEESAPNADDFKQPTSGLTTVVLPPAPRIPELTPAQLKKNRDREYQRKKRAAASHRSVGTVSDDEGSATTAGGRRPIKRVRVAEDD
ncbi:histone acetyltransferase subunit NuA4-domain-containing protein [Russula earlei]|uniref:Histone acetyltransferase subunit NuA4-domain-containing protein n=1 Tax=Russula earlei TaxID=71964 RepID=A0ACC0TX13_9AGAM|nr:histone acetyltransferase subunit NuA4-domain-containing protein [Russula earlei]